MFVALARSGTELSGFSEEREKRTHTLIHWQPTQSFHHSLNDTSDSTMYSSHALHRLPIALETKMHAHTVRQTALLVTLRV